MKDQVCEPHPQTFPRSSAIQLSVSLSEGAPGSSPSGSPAPLHRDFSHQALLQHIDTDKQNRLDCQDSAWAQKTFRTLQVLLWGQPASSMYLCSLPSSYYRKASNFLHQLPLVAKDNDLILPQVPSLSPYTMDEKPNLELQSIEHGTMGQCSAYTLGTESHDKVCVHGDCLCHSVVHLCDIYVISHTSARGFRSSR